jgi:hypothetical protein
LCAAGCCGEFPDAAGRVGSVTADQKTTNHIIGLSFTAEMEVIGAWEGFQSRSQCAW